VRILVCDDDVVVSMAMSMARDDVEVHEARRVHEVVGVAREVRPDAIVLDIKLPDGDGLEAARAVRADATIADVVVVVLTAGHDPERRGEVLAAGADEYVAKPFDPEALVTLLRQLVAVPAGERRIRRTLHRARLHSGRDDGGTSDLPSLDAAPEQPAPKRRRFRRSGSA
jgi:DNA-binding response OmpR family regulator